MSGELLCVDTQWEIIEYCRQHKDAIEFCDLVDYCLTLTNRDWSRQICFNAAFFDAYLRSVARKRKAEDTAKRGAENCKKLSATSGGGVL